MNLYESSKKVLETVQLSNGGCLASPPGKRYPYVYPRDHAYCIFAFNESKQFDRAKMALEFAFKAQLQSGAFPQRFDKQGKDASYKPIQLDGSGLLLYGLIQYYSLTKDSTFIKKYESKIRKALVYMSSQLRQNGLLFTPNSIHEFPPLEEGCELYANAVCCGALLNLQRLDCLKLSNKYHALGKSLKKSIIKMMFNPKLGYFVKNIREGASSSVATNIDMSIIALWDFGVLKSNHKMLLSSITVIEKELTHLGGICRYPRHIGRNNGGWGPWPHFTLMLARYYLANKQPAKARRLGKWVEAISYEGNIPEHIATKEDFEYWITEYETAGIMRPDRKVMAQNVRKHPTYKKGTAYAVMPLAWPHAEYIRYHHRLIGAKK